MSINKTTIIIYLLAIIFAYLFGYNTYKNISSSFNTKTIEQLDITVLQSYKTIFNTKKQFGYLWGLKNIEKPKPKSKKKTKVHKKQKTKILPVQFKNKSLCIKKDCFRFLGIYTKNKVNFLSLYNKNFPHKIKNLKKNDKIRYSLIVKEIHPYNAIILDKDSNRTWEFKLFHVDPNKYKPKGKK